MTVGWAPRECCPCDEYADCDGDRTPEADGVDGFGQIVLGTAAAVPVAWMSRGRKGARNQPNSDQKSAHAVGHDEVPQTVKSCFASRPRPAEAIFYAGMTRLSSPLREIGRPGGGGTLTGV